MSSRKADDPVRNRRAQSGGERLTFGGSRVRVRFCPGCRSLDVYPSHRRGWVEHGPFTWIGVLPFRCGACQTRFYRFAAHDPRRRRSVDVVSPVDRSRAPRWHFRGSVTLAAKPHGEPLSLTGETENIGFFGARVRFPQALPIGTRVRVSIEGQPARDGTVRWSKPHAAAGHWHGIEFRTPFKGPRGSTCPYVIMRLRVYCRRVAVAALILFLMAAAAAGLVHVMDIFRNYDPKYYEPKDIERQQYQEQQQQQPPARPPAR
jgi:hypothetical protein